jgi:hypothetical protein
MICPSKGSLPRTPRAWRLSTIRCRRILAATACAVTLAQSAAVAMTFRIIKTPETNAIVGEGLIEDGDAGRLEKIIPLAGRDSYGNIPLYLNSPGGLVDAAFAIVAVMDKEEFSALVSSGARCASACASIVYISARFHEVVGTGLLGIHTCYRVNGRPASPQPDSFCNEIIAQNAVNHGTSYGALQMWQSHTGPENMAWIDQKVACEYGLCGPPVFDNTPAVPSFDCSAATLAAEIAICSDKRLARHEASLSKKYVAALKAMPEPDKRVFRAEQRAWLSYRNSCQGDAVGTCVLQRMNERWNEVMQKWAKYVLKAGYQ